MSIPSVTYDDLKAYPWDEILLGEKQKESYRLSSVMFSKGGECSRNSDERGRKVYWLIGSILGFQIEAGSKTAPYKASWQSNDSRSAIPDDFDEDTISAFEKVVPDIRTVELKARICDILWLRRRKIEAAKQAIDCFLEGAVDLIEQDGGWPAFTPQIQRALSLAVSLGRGNEPFNKVSGSIQDLIEKRHLNENGLLCCTLIEFLVDHRTGDPAALAKISTGVAERLERDGLFHFARRYWEVAAKLWQFEKQPEESQKAKLRAAETFVSEATSAGSRPGRGGMAIANFLGQAVVALRRAGADSSRVQAVHRQMLDAQEGIHDEMGQISTPLDIQGVLQHTRSGISGKSLVDALSWLAVSSRPTDVPALKKRVMDQAAKFPMQHLMHTSIVDGRGRTVAHVPGLLGVEGAELEQALTAHMVHQANMIDWHLRVVGLVLPAADIIWEEHHPQERDLNFILEGNPFIGEGRGAFVIKGLFAGLSRDYETVGHYLIPEIEHTIRHVAEARGAIPTDLSDELLQKEYGLGKLFELEQVKTFLGEGLLFDLKGLLTNAIGGNLRNRFAHGMMEHGDYYGISMIYFWSTMMHLYLHPFLRRMVAEQKQNEPEKTGGSS